MKKIKNNKNIYLVDHAIGIDQVKVDKVFCFALQLASGLERTL